MTGKEKKKIEAVLEDLENLLDFTVKERCGLALQSRLRSRRIGIQI
jgi:hypothetical protein